MNAAYSQAIEILMNPSVDFRAIVIALAKAHPEILVNIVGPRFNPPQWQRDVVRCAQDYNRVGAVKIYRNNTGSSLKEALDVVNQLHNLLFQNGYVNNRVDCDEPGLVTLSEAKKLYNSTYSNLL